eukprot:363602_1
MLSLRFPIRRVRPVFTNACRHFAFAKNVPKSFFTSEEHPIAYSADHPEKSIQQTGAVPKEIRERLIKELEHALPIHVGCDQLEEGTSEKDESPGTSLARTNDSSADNAPNKHLKGSAELVDVTEAANAVEHMDKNPVEHFCETARRLNRHMPISPEQAITLCDRMFHASLEQEEIRNTTRVLFDQPDGELGKFAFDRCVEAGHDPACFATTVGWMCYENRPPSMQMFVNLMKNYQNIGAGDVVLQLFDRFTASYRKPDREFLHLMLKFLVGGPAVQDDALLRVLGQFREHTITPNRDTFHLVMRFFLNKQQAEQVMVAFERMLNHKLEPNAETFEIILNVHAKQQPPDLDKLWNLLQSASDHKIRPSATMFHPILKACEAAGNDGDALAVRIIQVIADTSDAGGAFGFRKYVDLYGCGDDRGQRNVLAAFERLTTEMQKSEDGSLAPLESSNRWHFSDHAAINALLLQETALPAVLRVLERTWRGFDCRNTAAAVFALNRAVNTAGIDKLGRTKAVILLRENIKALTPLMTDHAERSIPRMSGAVLFQFFEAYFPLVKHFEELNGDYADGILDLVVTRLQKLIRNDPAGINTPRHRKKATTIEVTASQMKGFVVGLAKRETTNREGLPVYCSLYGTVAKDLAELFPKLSQDEQANLIDSVRTIGPQPVMQDEEAKAPYQGILYEMFFGAHASSWLDPLKDEVLAMDYIDWTNENIAKMAVALTELDMTEKSTMKDMAHLIMRRGRDRDYHMADINSVVSVMWAAVVTHQNMDHKFLEQACTLIEKTAAANEKMYHASSSAKEFPIDKRHFRSPKNALKKRVKAAKSASYGLSTESKCRLYEFYMGVNWMGAEWDLQTINSDLLRDCFDAYYKRPRTYIPPITTTIMKDVLDSMEVDYNIGYRDEQGLDVDVALNSSGGERFAVQFKGTPSRSAKYSDFKMQLLNRLGWRVCVVDLKKWDELLTNPDHQLNFKLEMGIMIRENKVKKKGILNDA